MKRVLVLGAGLVSRPLVRYLLGRPDFDVCVATRTVEKAKELVAGAPRGTAVALEATDTPALEQLISQSDLTISLLPYTHHVQVARLCIALGKHLITTSYVSPAMRELDEPARRAGVLLLNEIGLDPGIDHMSAMQVIHRVQSAGGRVTGFTSYCGGLPAPDANTNPFGYKFSWSPRGVLLAGRNAARFLKNGQVIEIPGPELFDHYWPVLIEELGELEGYPNRDSLPYLETYGIAGASDMLRATLRYPGWCSTMKKLVELGLLDDSERPDWAGRPWGDCMLQLIGAPAGAEPRRAVAGFLGIDWRAPELERLAWLGLFGQEPVPAGCRSPLDALVAQMLQKMSYGPDERDMIILQHIFTARYPHHAEQITSTLIDYGEPGGDSSMARTVSLPAAIATRLILEGRIALVGVQIPVRPEIYRPVLEELSCWGITPRESSRPLSASTISC